MTSIFSPARSETENHVAQLKGMVAGFLDNTTAVVIARTQ